MLTERQGAAAILDNSRDRTAGDLDHTAADVAAVGAALAGAPAHRRTQLVDELDVLAEHLVGHADDRAIRLKARIHALRATAASTDPHPETTP